MNTELIARLRAAENNPLALNEADVSNLCGLAADELEKTCETCRHQYQTYRVGAPRIHIAGCSRISKPCEDVGDSCGRWEHE